MVGAGPVNRVDVFRRDVEELAHELDHHVSDDVCEVVLVERRGFQGPAEQDDIARALPWIRAFLPHRCNTEGRGFSTGNSPLEGSIARHCPHHKVDAFELFAPRFKEPIYDFPHDLFNDLLAVRSAWRHRREDVATPSTAELSAATLATDAGRARGQRPGAARMRVDVPTHNVSISAG